MKYIISVEGNIGSGKSTLLKYLKTHVTEIDGYKVIYLKEPVNSWNEIIDLDGKTIIEKFYANQQKYSFSFQMMAYITRLTQLKNAISSAPENCIIITERCLYTDRNIFAKMLYDSKIMEHIEYTIYMKWFDEFIEFTKLTALIYIKTTPEICVERIEKRARSGEETIPLDYLTTCHNYHSNWLDNTDIDIVTLDGNNINYENLNDNKNMVNHIIDMIKLFIDNSERKNNLNKIKNTAIEALEAKNHCC